MNGHSHCGTGRMAGLSRLRRAILTGIICVASGVATQDAQAMGRGQNAAATESSATGRAPGFPATLQQDYVAVAPNDLGITSIFVDYVNAPNTQPSIAVDVGKGYQQTS